MGAYFQLEHANLVTYLTAAHSKCPQVKYRQLVTFLEGLAYGWKGTLISNDECWPERVGSKAAASLANIPQSERWSENIVAHQDVESLLGSLRRELSRYLFYALAVFDPKHGNLNRRLLAFMTNGAYGSETAGLFLISSEFQAFNYDSLDPSPPIQAVAKNISRAPGVIFWNSNAAAFVHVSEADQILARIMAAGKESRHAITAVLQECSSGPEDKRLLHLSDLHFGTSRAIAMQEYLVASVAREAKSVDRIVITGDLFDTPNAAAMNAFQSFRYQLERLTNKDVILVPGNHDESFKGNRLGGLGQNLQQVASLEWSSLVIDDAMRCVFFGFDSSLDANLAARGVVTQEQLVRIGTQYQTRLERNPDLANYLSVALVHHHPFSWSANEPSIFGYSLENLLFMEHAEVFLKWCVRKRIPLILHGHKHQPRHVVETISAEDIRGAVTSIGCGSSLGAGDGPLSYNILYWHADSRNWSASFMVDPGDASGFAPRYVSMSSAGSA